MTGQMCKHMTGQKESKEGENKDKKQQRARRGEKTLISKSHSPKAEIFLLYRASKKEKERIFSEQRLKDKIIKQV